MTVTPITEDEVSQMVMKVKKEKKEKKQRKKKTVLADAPAPTTDEAVVVVKPKRTLPPALKEWTLYHTHDTVRLSKGSASLTGHDWRGWHTD